MRTAFALALCLALFAAVGCGGTVAMNPGPVIGPTGSDASVPITRQDGAPNNMPDLAQPTDGSLLTDLPPSRDTSAPADMTLPPDMTRPPDTARPPDLTPPSADMTPPPPISIFPPDNAWNTDISGAAVDSQSSVYINNISAGTGLHGDFDSVGDGIPYVIVPGSQALVPITYNLYGDESDPGPFPIPLNAPIENASDGHVIAVDLTHGFLYELYIASEVVGGWVAAGGAKWNLQSNAGRTPGWTSADAAGLPIFPGLVRYDEVMQQHEIRHALRFTVERTQHGYVTPASHYASSSYDTARPPMGLRLRLKASVNISSYPQSVQVILTALKKYGMILADNGSNWFISGAPDPRWPDDEIHKLSQIHGSDFEVITHGPIVTN